MTSPTAPRSFQGFLVAWETDAKGRPYSPAAARGRPDSPAATGVSFYVTPEGGYFTTRLEDQTVVPIDVPFPAEAARTFCEAAVAASARVER